MKLCRYNDNRLGLVDLAVGEVADVTGALKLLPKGTYPFPKHDVLIENLPKIRKEVLRLAKRAKRTKLSKVKLLSPVANPGKIIGAPINYADHLAEANKDAQLAHGRDMKNAEIYKWGLFLKAGSSLIGVSDTVMIRKPYTSMENRNDHEIELVAVIGKRANKVKYEDALKYVAGYTIGLDMTLRGPQFAGFRKSIDTYAVLGPWLVTSDEFGHPGDIGLKISVNGELRQESNTKHLIYDVAKLIEFASSFYTLYPGDLIYTGTPAGVGPVKNGDLMTASIDRIGEIQVKVKDA